MVVWCPPCSVLASLERLCVEMSKGGGCLFLCLMELACCPKPISPGYVLSSQWSLHVSPHVDVFQIIMQPMEHYNYACGSFFSSNSHVSFFLSGNLCVIIPPMCDCAWRFLPSGVWDLGASDPSWEILVFLSKKITSKNSIMNVCCMVSIPSSLMRYVALFFLSFHGVCHPRSFNIATFLFSCKIVPVLYGLCGYPYMECLVVAKKFSVFYS